MGKGRSRLEPYRESEPPVARGSAETLPALPPPEAHWASAQPAAGAGLADVRRRCGSLEVLDLMFNALGDAGVEALAAALKEGAGAKLHELDLQGNGITAKGAQALAGCLAACGSLRTLSLMGNKLDDAAEQTLREAVAGREGFQQVL